MTRMFSSVCVTFLLVLVFGPAGGAALADEAKYETGRSSVTIEGLQVELNVPAGLSKEKPSSLVIILHGAGGTATGMAGTLHEWGSNGYVVCAPKSKGQVWSDSDVDAVLRIGAHLKAALPIDPKRVHVIGFSNGGWNLGPLAFDDELHPCSATWVAAGCSGGKVPKWAAKELGVLALAGSNDPNAGAARSTAKILGDSVRSVTVRFQPGLDHKWPSKLMPYFKWWMDTMDGRFVPGKDMNFEWGEDLDKAVAALAGKKKGGVLVYAYQPSDAENPVAQALQRELLMHPLVQHYGSQLQAVKLDYAKCKDRLEALGVKTTPALVVLKKDGKPKKVLAEKSLKARKIAAALKGVAPNKKAPGK